MIKKDGIIIINKQKNYTSHDVVAIVRKMLRIKKIGHTGTLDPNATGVLPLLIGNGTKMSKYIIDHDKEYEVVLKLGVKTDTADGEGKILETDDINIGILKEEKIKEVLKSFLGKQEQIPPMYSAIKVNGKKLYEYARNGQTIEIKPRQIEIYNIDFIDINNKEKEISFKVECSKGTYIRSLCEDIAKKLNTIGYMKELNRTRVGKFRIENSILIEDLENNLEENLKNKIITMEQFFKELHKIEINEKQKEKFLNGVKIKVEREDGIYNIYDNKKEYMGIGIVKQNLLKRDIIII